MKYLRQPKDIYKTFTNIYIKSIKESTFIHFNLLKVNLLADFAYIFVKHK